MIKYEKESEGAAKAFKQPQFHFNTENLDKKDETSNDQKNTVNEKQKWFERIVNTETTNTQPEPQTDDDGDDKSISAQILKFARKGKSKKQKIMYL